MKRNLKLQLKAFQNGISHSLSGKKSGLFCPICGYISFVPLGKEFEFLDKSKPNVFSEEDVPPRSIGGKKMCYTHQYCNNSHGKNEVHLRDAYNVRNSGKANRAFLEVADAKVPVELDFKKSQVTMKEPNNPRLGALKKDGSSNLRFSWISPDLHRQGVSILKTAYLYLFMKYGHKHIVSKQFELIRKQLREPDNKILNSCGYESIGVISDGFYRTNLKTTIAVFFKGFIGLLPDGGVSGDLVRIWSTPYGAQQECEFKYTFLEYLPSKPEYLKDFEGTKIDIGEITTLDFNQYRNK